MTPHSVNSRNEEKQVPSWIPNAITFFAGASYGVTTVIIGQPLDTIKTRMQGLATTLRSTTSSSSPSQKPPSTIGVLRELYGIEGIRGLYRGGLPLLLGGSFMRSAQFGVSAETRSFLQRHDLPNYRILGTVDSNVLLAGIAGGLGRALVEIPTDFFKIRRQVHIHPGHRPTLDAVRRQILDGGSVTMVRNTVLFAAFIVYVDLSKRACGAGVVPRIFRTEDGNGLTPFAKGAVCANMAWLTCWPMDVVKTQKQSGNYRADATALRLLADNLRAGRLFRGILPGLLRSTIANGSSMVVYEAAQSGMSDYFGVVRKDMM